MVLYSVEYGILDMCCDNVGGAYIVYCTYARGDSIFSLWGERTQRVDIVFDNSKYTMMYGDKKTGGACTMPQSKREAIEFAGSLFNQLLIECARRGAQPVA